MAMLWLPGRHDPVMGSSQGGRIARVLDEVAALAAALWRQGVSV